MNLVVWVLYVKLREKLILCLKAIYTCIFITRQPVPLWTYARKSKIIQRFPNGGEKKVGGSVRKQQGLLHLLNLGRTAKEVCLCRVEEGKSRQHQ